MKYVVKNGFIDKNTGKAYSIGDSYECDSLRAEEITASGDFLEVMDGCNSNDTQKKK